MTLSRLNKLTSQHTWSVVGIFLISTLLRGILVARGGQFYFSDESRYQISRDIAQLILHGESGKALAYFFSSPEHLGFKLIGMIPATFENFYRASVVLPAFFFSLFSVLNLYVIYRLSLRTGASPNQSLMALVFAASSHTLLYYSRHLMPYDTALFFGLLALHIGLNENATLKTSFACGLFGCLCFVTYNGYWILAAFGMLAHVFVRNKWDFVFLRKAILTTIGFILPILFFFILARAFGINLFSEYSQFARSINQGDFAEGWILPFEYFWNTEHLSILMFGGLSFYSIVGMFRNREQKHDRTWATGLVFIYLCLLVFSVFLHTFVVYGRLVRQMMPFLVLLSASGWREITQRLSWGSTLIYFVVTAVVLQGAWNFAMSYNVSYPREFVAQAEAEFPDFEFSEKRMTFGAPTVCKYNGYIIENVKYFLTPPDPGLSINGRLLLSALHPVNFLPYQYEGYPPAKRKLFRELKLRMNLYQVEEGFMSESNPAWTSIKSCVVKDK